MIVYEMKGIHGRLVVYEDKIEIIRKGILGFIGHGIKGTKTIPIASISAIQFRKSSISSGFNGYIEFTIPGGNESKKGILSATTDENTFLFSGDNKKANEIIKFIENKLISQAKIGTSPKSDIATQLQKLADLHKNGALTDEEYHAAKEKVINS